MRKSVFYFKLNLIGHIIHEHLWSLSEPYKVSLSYVDVVNVYTFIVCLMICSVFEF